MAFETNHFCWFGVASGDVARARQFYTAVLGWTETTFRFGDDESTMFATADGTDRAHLSGSYLPGAPSFWESYLRVDQVDASHDKAIELGGSEVMPPVDVPKGRISAVRSPTGALLHLFHEADEDEASEAPAGPGSIHWTELFSTDVASDLAWLQAAFGMGVDEMPLPDGVYHVLEAGPDDHVGVGGCTRPMVPGMSSAFVSWVHVPNLDAAASRVQQHGGKLLGGVVTMDGVGRLLVCGDCAGAVFGIIQPMER